MISFHADEYARYNRQFALREIGPAGQEKIKEATIALVGVGGIGCPAALYLAAAGIGRLILIDPDTIALSNLNRQILFHTSHIGQSKIEIAKTQLLALNPHLHIDLCPHFFPHPQAEQLLSEADIVIDGSDNYPTRYAVNRVCALKRTPLLSASVYGWSGQLGFYNVHDGPCYACVYPEPPPPHLIPNCEESGILGVIPGILALQAVHEALKYLLGLSIQTDHVMVYEALPCRITHYPIIKKSDCPVCVHHSIQKEDHLVKYNPKAPPLVPEMTVQEFNTLRQQSQPHLLVDVREDWERQICNIAGSVAMPLSRFEAECATLSKKDPIIVHCRTGGRSACATKILEDLGFTNVRNLQGGILEWIDQIDPTQSKY
jgi:adenylyltransferase/sulfurtransferase